MKICLYLSVHLAEIRCQCSDAHIRRLTSCRGISLWLRSMINAALPVQTCNHLLVGPSRVSQGVTCNTCALLNVPRWGLKGTSPVATPSPRTASVTGSAARRGRSTVTGRQACIPTRRCCHPSSVSAPNRAPRCPIGRRDGFPLDRSSLMQPQKSLHSPAGLRSDTIIAVSDESPKYIFRMRTPRHWQLLPMTGGISAL